MISHVMFLTSEQIERYLSQGDLHIDPFVRANLKGASYTFTIGSKMRVLKEGVEPIDSRNDPEYIESEVSEDGYELKPGAFAIFYTKEKVTLNNQFVCLLSTRASIAQMGLDATQGSFFCEPDTANHFALEITNRSPVSIQIYQGTKIGKGVFAKVQ